VTTLRSISYGGGVQSTALLVLAAQGRIDFPLFLMANVGDDSEHPDTLAYVRDVAMPYAAEHDIEMVMLDRLRRDGSTETLWGRLMDQRPCRNCRGTGSVFTNHHDDETRPCGVCGGSGKVDSRSLPIPVRMSNGAPGNRSCTADFKIRVIGKELKRRGARGPKRCSAHSPCIEDGSDDVYCGPVPHDCSDCDPGNVATIGIGISLDEIQRANARKVEPHERVVYPLIGIGEETGLKMRRDDCIRLIRESGLPVPPKSSCFFCPLHRPTAWADLHRERPDLFARSVELEETLNRRRDARGKDHVFLTRYGRPLADVIDTDQALLPMFDPADGACDSGWCFT
jgi:hypothetical protein